MTENFGNGIESFKQQELKAWQPVLTPVAVIGVLLSVGIIFMPIGIVLRDASEDVISYKYRYDNIPSCYVTSDMNYTVLPKNCTLSFTIDKDMKAPIYFYYELDNFYQNHRRYLKSKNDEQLRGESNTNTEDCDPLKTFNGKSIVTCGLISNSFFEDRFNMYINNNIDLCNGSCINYGINNVTQWHNNWDKWYNEPNWSIDGISWDSDDDKFIYNEIDNSSQTQVGVRQSISGLRLPDVDNPDFMVWMRVAALPNFRKLHRIIKNIDLKKGDNITVEILSWFPVADFSGKKYISISTAEWCGGENYSLAWTFIIVSTISLTLAVLFAVLLLFGSRKMGAVELFEWQNRPKKLSSLVHLS